MKVDLPEFIHIVGIAGSACSGLARLLLERGCRISGSDNRGGETLDQLHAVGADVFRGHHKDNLHSEVNLVIFSAAIPEDNSELVEARSRGVETLKYAQFLGRLLDDSFGIAVAGTHGKTTTSGMLASILLAAGKDPTVLIGGNHPGLGGRNWRAGTGSEMVVEACEFDRSFHSLHPDAAVVLNVDHDHIEMYPRLEDVQESFTEFVRGVSEGGPLVIWADDPFLSILPEEAKKDLDIRTFGFLDNAQYKAAYVETVPTPRFRVYKQDLATEENQFWGEVTLNDRVHGAYSVLDAMAALTLADAIGISAKEVIKGLADFPGMSRRFECHEIHGVQWVDDYAHHPTEIQAVLESARELYPDRTIWALFQPHQPNRLKAFLSEFASALELADRIAVLPPYVARGPANGLVEDDLIELLLRELKIKRGKTAVERFHSLKECSRRFPTFLSRGDVVIACGAGDLTEVGIRFQEQDAAVGGLSVQPMEGIRKGVSLSDHCTYKTGGPARWLGEPRNREELLAFDRWAREEGIPRFYLGGGSNTLFDDDGFAGLVILTQHLDRISFDEDGILEVEAGASLINVIRQANDRGWSGLEEFVGIPGSVGGAVWGNAGASGGWIEKLVDGIEVIDESGEFQWLTATSESLDWSYRHSGIGERAIVRVRFKLTEGADPRELKSRSKSLQEYKQQTQPLSARSCGCVFTNPPGELSAGALIEAAGLKGQSLGGAKVSEKHANFIINDGNATSNEILALSEKVRDRVEEIHGVRLKHEMVTPSELGRGLK